MRSLDAETLRALLTELADALAEQGTQARIYIVGGAAMALAWDSRRSTHDVDALLTPRTDVLAVAAEIGSRHGLDATWLNDAVRPFVPPTDESLSPRTLARIGAVDIVIAPPEHVLAMKMAAFRGVDRADLTRLVEVLDLTTEEEVVAVCERAYGTDGVVLPSHEDLHWQARVVLGHQQVARRERRRPS